MRHFTGKNVTVSRKPLAFLMQAQYTYLSSDFLWGDIYGQANTPSPQSSGALVLGPPEWVIWSGMLSALLISENKSGVGEEGRGRAECRQRETT